MDEARIVVSFKADNSYGSPLLVFRGDTPEQVMAIMNAAAHVELFGRVRNVAGHFSGAGNTQDALSAVREQFPAATVTQDTGYQPPWEDAPPPRDSYTPPPRQELPAGNGRACEQCGAPAQFKQGTNSSGKPYKGYFCTSGERGHPVQWVR